MIPSNEPKDGDFIAYIEQLQEQQAARLHARGQAGEDRPAQPEVQFPAAAPSTTSRVPTHRAGRRALPGLASAVVPLFIGFAIGLNWLIGGSGLLSLMIALALVAYGARQFHRIRQLQSADHSQAAARIAQMLGQIRK